VLFKFINNKNTASVASKIVQQMNVKLGMPLWSIPRPKSVSDRTMLIGIDIYHKLVAGN
jgi:aubergine-like protein